MSNQTIVRFFAGAELFALLAFIAGYFTDLYLLMLIGGILLVIQDIFSMVQGILNPIFPIILAIVLAMVFTPLVCRGVLVCRCLHDIEYPNGYKKIENWPATLAHITLIFLTCRRLCGALWRCAW